MCNTVVTIKKKKKKKKKKLSRESKFGEGIPGKNQTTREEAPAGVEAPVCSSATATRVSLGSPAHFGPPSKRANPAHLKWSCKH